MLNSLDAPQGVAAFPFEAAAFEPMPPCGGIMLLAPLRDTERHSMVKHGVKISILLIWLALMGWWWAESRTWPVPEKIDAAFLPDYNDYYSLKYNGQKIGWSYRSLRRLPGGDYQAGQSTVVRVLLAEEEVEVKSSVLVNTDKSLSLINFTYVLQAGPLTLSESGEVAGGRLSVGVNLGPYAPMLEEFLARYGEMLGGYADKLDFSREAVLDPPDGPGLTSLLPSYLSYLGLEVGRNYNLKMLDPAGRKLTTVPVRIEEEGQEYEMELGREVPSYKLRLGGEAGGGTEIWIDRFGRVYRESALGFSYVREESQFEAVRNIEPLTPPSSFLRLIDTESLKNIIDQAIEKEGGPADGPTVDQPSEQSE